MERVNGAVCDYHLRRDPSVCIAILILVSSVRSGAAQLPIRTYTTADGLARDRVYKIVSDPDFPQTLVLVQFETPKALANLSPVLTPKALANLSPVVGAKRTTLGSAGKTIKIFRLLPRVVAALQPWAQI